MAGALDGELAYYLPTIMSHLRDAIAPRKEKPFPEALACVGSIAKAMGPAMEPHIRSLLDAMFSGGLSSHLVKALEQFSHSIPTLLPTIQDRLLDCIAVSLSRSQHSLARTVSTGRSNATPPIVSDVTGAAVVQLALQTLAHFNIKGHDLLEFAKESALLYLEDEDPSTRKDAALCCCSHQALSSAPVGLVEVGEREGAWLKRLWRSFLLLLLQMLTSVFLIPSSTL